ncbi:MAG: alpha/beta fold hydrolase [Bacteroidetes bacterium]|nr:alpha/beta fold hydrolase [Bacteroidota bacterium]
MKLNYKSFGNGPPIIIVHGLFGMLDNWITIARKFENDYTVYLVDQRNHGKSGRSDVFNYQAMSDDLLEFMDTNNIQTSHLIGHSMGGKTIMQFAFDYPERVNKLVVADIGPVQYENKHEMIINAMLSIDFSQQKSRQDVEELLSKTIKSKRLLQFLMKNLYWKDKNNLGWKTNMEAVLENMEKIGEAIASDKPYMGPALFVRGGRSDYVTLKEMHQIKMQFPIAEIKTINGATHWLHYDKPDDFFALVSDFLRLV